MTKSTKILLVRHGQDTDNVAGILNGHRDTELTELGRSQARQTAEKLRGRGVELIYASPLRRTYETARLINEVLGLDEIVADAHLIERNFGVLTGKPIADIPKYTDKFLPTEKVNYFLEAEGSEDFPTLLERARAVVRELRERHPGQTILVVTHGDIGKMIRAAYHDWTWEQGLKTPYFSNAGVLELVEGEDVVS
jgi:broad specificity phosphatase PhoE